MAGPFLKNNSDFDCVIRRLYRVVRIVFRKFRQHILQIKIFKKVLIQGVSKQVRKTLGGDSLFKIKGSLLHKRWVKCQPLGRYRGTKMAEK